MKLSELATRCTGNLHGADIEFDSLSTDTRTIQRGDLFVALKGDNFDGHDYVETAIEKGAGAVVVSRYLSALAVPALEVADTCTALGKAGQLQRERSAAVVTAITGSSGKTSVKGFLQSVCELAGSTLATRGNFNNHIGVPLTLMELQPSHQFAVVEAGTNSEGEIAYLTDLIRPDVAMVTNVMPAHIGGFGSLEAIAREKSAIYGQANLKTAIVNLDDQFAPDFLQRLKGKQIIGVRELSAGSSQVGPVSDIAVDRELTISSLSADSAGCYQFRMSVEGMEYDVKLSVPGRHQVINAAMAAAAAVAMGIEPLLLAEGLKSYFGSPGRMQVVETGYCKVLIDDTYNANPGSMRAAVDFIVGFDAPCLVLGDMGELGSAGAQLHAELGEYARERGVQQLLAWGELSRSTVDAFGEGGSWYPSCDALLTAVGHLNLKNNAVLVKGSRSAKMERVVAQLEECHGVQKC